MRFRVYRTVLLATALLLLWIGMSTLTGIAEPFGQLTSLEEIKNSSPSSTIDQEASANRVNVRLVRAEFASDATTLRLRLSLENQQVSGDTFLPIVPDRIDVTGVGGDPATFGQVAQHAVIDGVVPVDVVVGPVTAPEEGATITITDIGVRRSSEPPEYARIAGPWRFTLEPQDIAVDPLDTVIPVHQTVTKGAVSVTVSDVHLSSRAVSVRYRIAGQADSEMMPATGIQMVLPDGRAFHGDGQRGKPDTNGERTVNFPPLPDGVTSFMLSFGKYVVPEPGPAEVTFDIPVSLDRTATDTDKTTVDTSAVINQSFILGGESMKVASLTINGDRIQIEVDNAEPAGQGNVLFVGPNTGDQILVDDLGHEYKALGGHFGFNKDDSGRLSAGSSGVTFRGPLDPHASSLTIRVGHYGRSVPGPDPIRITVP